MCEFFGCDYCVGLAGLARKKWNIQNYEQDLPQSLCGADKSKLKIKIPGTHTVH